MARVQFERVTKVFANGVRAVDDFSLDVGEGECVVLVGPSGSGKSTALRLLAGLEQPTGGSLYLGGRRVNGLSPRERDVAMVFQRPALYPHLTVRRNLALGLQLRSGWGGIFSRETPEVAGRVAEVAAALDLTGVLERRPAQLSGGQQQRVALGRALARRPAAYLLDEPFSQLDQHLRAGMRRELHLLRRRFPATMIFVTHDQVEAITLADRLVVLHEGRIHQVGPPHEVYNHPENRFVAGFLGWPAMNLLDGRFARGAGGPRLTSEGVALPLPGSWGTVVEDGRAITLGVRPEDVEVGPAGPDSPGAVAEVALVEPTGPGQLLTLRYGPWTLTAQVGAGQGVRAGQRVVFTMKDERIRGFDGASGKALTGGRPAG